MSHYLVELYSPNPAWLALPAAQRQQFLEGCQRHGQPGCHGRAGAGPGRDRERPDQASPHRFLGIWRFPDTAARDALLAGIKASGWYGYFDHVNAASGTGGLESHLKALAEV